MYATISDAVHIVVGNKIDKDTTGEGLSNSDSGRGREVTREEGIDFAKACRALFVETSAFRNEGIKRAFAELVMQILETPSLAAMTQPKSKDVNNNDILKIRGKRKNDEFDKRNQMLLDFQ